MEKELSDEDMTKLSQEYDIELRLLKTILYVESAEAGFDKWTGKIKIQFEPHVFKRYTNVLIINGVEKQSREWVAFEKAYEINPRAALLSTSWGLGQIMGFNFKEAGYETVEDMVQMFKMSEYFQFKGMLDFISRQPKMLKALKEKNWEEFARRYNGPAYKAFKYDYKLARVYNNLT